MPDLDVFVGYRTTGGGVEASGHGFAVELSVPLTFLDHGQGQVQSAQAEHAVAIAQAERLKTEISALRNSALARLDALANSATRLEQALALVERVRGDAERLYLAGEGSLLAALEAHRRIRGLAMARIDVTAAVSSAHLDLISAAGRFGDRKLDDACGASSP